MRNYDFPSFFNQIATEFILLEDKRVFFEAVGVDPEDWPDIEAKKIMQKFLTDRALKGLDFAKFQAMKPLQEISGAEIPEDRSSFTSLYHEGLTQLRAFELASRISRDPQNVERYVAGFRIRKSESDQVVNFADEVQDIVRRQGERVDAGKALVVIDGWSFLSKAVGGFNPGRVSLLAAGTGVGKTMLALNLARGATKHHTTLVVNMEMNFDDIGARVIQSGAMITNEDWNTGVIDYERMTTFMNDLQERKKLWITKGRSMSMLQIKAMIRLLKEQGDLGFVFIDYDQKILIPRGMEEWQALQLAVQELEEVAKIENLHIMLLSQANDDGDPKASKRSKQPASTVLHFHEHESGVYLIEAIKNRFGRRGVKIRVNFKPEMAFIEEQQIYGADEKIKPLAYGSLF